MASFYEKYGGMETVSGIVHRFYERLLDDEATAHFFEGVKMERLISHQIEFIAHALGGPATVGVGSLAKAHQPLDITDADFDRVAAHLSETLYELGIEPADIEAILELVGTLRPQVVKHPAGPRILVVDDSRSWQVLIRERLPEGTEVVGATGAEEAQRLAETETFDLVLLDLNMPGVMGLELLERFANDERMAHVPKVVCSSMPDPVSRVKALSLGAADILSKATPPNELKARIGAVLQRSKAAAA